MIEAKSLIQSAYFEMYRESICFVKTLVGVSQEKIINGQPYRCVPVPATIAATLSLEEPRVRAVMGDLLRRHWIRKFRAEGRTAYAIGTHARLFMVKDLEKQFGQARRTRMGAVYLTEWRWLSPDKWTGTTAWAYLEDQLKERGHRAQSATAKGRAQMQRLCAQVGVRTVRDVAGFFAKNYSALRKHFRWYGQPHPGLFCGFFFAVQDMISTGVPGVVHDRGGVSPAEEKDASAWTYL